MPDGKFFFIRSQLTDMVLTIKENVIEAGSSVGPFPCNGMDSQMWYEDKINGVMRSKADDNLCLETTGKSSRGKAISVLK